MDKNSQKLIIIGGGPAGISAAIYAARAAVKTTVITTATSALNKAKEVENYYGFINPISGQELLANGEEQAKRLGVEFLHQEVTRIEEVEEVPETAETSEISEVSAVEKTKKPANGFIVKTATADFPCGVVILATGASHIKPKWENINKFEGMGVSYCAVCDAFFYRNKDVAVAGSGSYALHEVEALLPLAKSVTLCTDGEPLTAQFPDNVQVITKKITKLDGETAISAIHFNDGDNLPISGLFLAIGTAGSSNLAAACGALISGTEIVVNETMATNVPNLLAAGDCTKGMKQIAKAVYQGAIAGTEARRILRAR
ncbi:MAG: NAD(P)/FAD-dependent oxidoreductase [Defluviitaleaceae bacterium]|nr:NAD(P)/FAD-dependent oxidoreductase [Defluviitaleaceae bacterium]